MAAEADASPATEPAGSWSPASPALSQPLTHCHPWCGWENGGAGSGHSQSEHENSRAGALYSIPAGAPFLDTLAQAILAGDLPRSRGSPPGPLDLAAYTLYLPNRRACRAMAEALLRAAPARATLLPRIRALGDAEQEGLIAAAMDEGDGEADTGPVGLPPAIDPLERHMALTQLVLSWARTLGRSASPAMAADLALELMRLLDQADTEQVDLGRVRTLIPERFADHWQWTLGFLAIVTEQWPRYLAAAGVVDPIARRNRLMAAEAERLAAGGTDAPVIVAGSTGSVPATARLMQAVLTLPQGAVVLPGLDLDLDAESWRVLLPDHPEHPQFGLCQLLERLGAPRVAVIRPAADIGPALRLRLVSEALRPAETTEHWAELPALTGRQAVAEAFAAVSLIAAPTAQDEAEAIALVLRHAAETRERTASLVTPDRGLARRVAAMLRKWHIVIDDSAGCPLRTTRQGAFFDLIAEVAAACAPTALLSLLKHPLCRLGLAPGAVREAARVLELTAFRQPWCGTGFAAMGRAVRQTREALARGQIRHPAIARLDEAQWQAASALLDQLVQAFQPLTRLKTGTGKVDSYIAAHVAVAEALAEGDGEALWSGEVGQAMQRLMTKLGTGLDAGPEIGFRDYPALYRSLIRREVVRPAHGGHPRLAILGPLEARLLQAHVTIIGGLNEGTWPETADPGPWLNRPMREALGLAAPERRIGLAAHDFWQLLGAPEVVLTRALKVDGVPTVPSRWLMRLQALLDAAGHQHLLAPQHPWAAWAERRHHAPARQIVPPPVPCPPVAARPRRLSVTDIERWIANPYAIYARHILGLQPLPALDAAPEGSDRGWIVHEALSRFASRHPRALPKDSAAALLAIADELLALFGTHSRLQAFWRPRIARFARWFAASEPQRRADSAKLFTEVRGTLTLAGPAGPFELTARADRIDLTRQGALAIYDYKTGAPPPETAVTALRAPQLPLEALIALEGRFAGLKARQVAKLAYISARGGEPPGAEIALVKQSPEDLALAAKQGLEALIARFDQPDTPYRALRRGAFKALHGFDDYAHLARVREWLDANEED